MSLARLALRLATCEVLSPSALAATGPFPTIAGPRVYDSRVDLLQEGANLDQIVGKPILIVYTEEDVSNPYGTAKHPPDEQVVTLVIEAMIAAKGTIAIETAPGQVQTFGTLEAALITTRQHEMLVDLIEAQARRVIDTRKRMPGTALLDAVAMEVHRIESFPQRAEDRATRLGARTIKFHVKVRKEVWSPVPVTPAPTGLDALPEPLRSVALGLPAASSGRTLCLQIADLIRQPAEAIVPLAAIAVSTVIDGDTDAPIASVVTTALPPPAP